MLRPAVAAALAAALVVPAAAPAATRQQRLFSDALLADPGTSSSVKRTLQRAGGFVAPDAEFADVTGDGTADAVVRVDSGGALGTVAVFVLSRDDRGDRRSRDLRVVFRLQEVHEATVGATGTSLVVRTPRWRAGDRLCCPSRVTERVYAWSDDRGAFTRRSLRTIEGFDGDGDRTSRAVA